jgi:hypothetical protein
MRCPEKGMGTCFHNGRRTSAILGETQGNKLLGVSKENTKLNNI